MGNSQKLEDQTQQLWNFYRHHCLFKYYSSLTMEYWCTQNVIVVQNVLGASQKHLTFKYKKAHQWKGWLHCAPTIFSMENKLITRRSMNECLLCGDITAEGYQRQDDAELSFGIKHIIFQLHMILNFARYSTLYSKAGLNEIS